MTYAEEPRIKLPPGDVVLIYGKCRVVRYVEGALVATGIGRGRSRYWTYNNVQALVVRNLQLKPGVTFDGFTAERLKILRTRWRATD